MMNRYVPLVAIVCLLAMPAGAVAQDGATSCEACHADSDLFDESLSAIVGNFAVGVHADVGLSCHDCHGGNPAAAGDDMDAAMDSEFGENPYRGVPRTGDIPGLCGSCHSDPRYMKRFRPDARVDQEAEYWTSQHGQRLEGGDDKVATCISCHGVHGILRSSDPQAPVYPTHLAETCDGCHGDPDHMAGYTSVSGDPLPVDQYARWRQSVHAQSLLEKEDLFAPTCNDCHGNHGAAPPGLESVAFVCGQCHGREAGLFRESPKRAGFDAHNKDNLPEMGDDGCAACHSEPEPQAGIKHISSFTECTTCHGNHGIVRPTIAMLAPLPETPCAFCHEPPDNSAIEFTESEKATHEYKTRRDELLTAATASGLEGDDLFDHLIDEALLLPAHTLLNETTAEGRPVLRAEFSRLFDKFRIGKTYFTYEDPVTGEVASQKLTRCTDCHAADGAGTAGVFLAKMREATVLTAQAERLLLASHRGGVEVREATLDLDRALDGQIELEVLVHGFDASEGSAFQEKHVETIEKARTALSGGQSGLDELKYRRQGLVVALVIIAFLLVGLALKIRQLPAS